MFNAQNSTALIYTGSDTPCIRNGGGLVIDESDRMFPATDQFASSGLEPRKISWMDGLSSGQDQGNDGACAMFAIQAWESIVLKITRPDREILDVWWEASLKTGRATDGLTVNEAFVAAKKAGWLQGIRAVQKVPDLGAHAEQPLLTGYVITSAWDHNRVSMEGSLDHLAPQHPRGLHLTCTCGEGHLSNLSGWRWIYIKNSWGWWWAWRGIGVMSYELHSTLIRGIWKMVK